MIPIDSKVTKIRTDTPQSSERMHQKNYFDIDARCIALSLSLAMAIYHLTFTLQYSIDIDASF